jgi:hypothetical protein
MDFLNNFIEKDPLGNTSLVIVIFGIVIISFVLLAYYIDYKKNSQNIRKIGILERAIKDLIEEFRSLELNFTEQKTLLHDYKYSLEKLDQEISRLADSHKGDSSITAAIQMANQGSSLEEISSATGMSKEEIEPIIKYHGKV